MPPPTYSPCLQDTDRQAARAAELQAIVQADQDDRKDPNQMNEAVASRDLLRRTRVAEIFAEGCFKTSNDYSAAALVFQHGDTADHVFQTFVWSKKAIELGDRSQMHLMADGIDRYLVRTGQKQLFATQAGINWPVTEKTCWCLEPVELSFPDSKREEYVRKNLQEAFEWVASVNAGKPGCSIPTYCNHSLKPSPEGTVPGFW